VGAAGPGGKKQKPITAMKKVYNVMKKFTYAFVALARGGRGEGEREGGRKKGLLCGSD